MPVTYLGVITGQRFAEIYNELYRQGAQPRASTLLQVVASPEPMVQAWIYHEKEIAVFTHGKEPNVVTETKKPFIID